MRALCKRISLSTNIHICQTPGNEALCKHNNPNDACVICRIFGSSFQDGKVIFLDGRINEESRKLIKAAQILSLIPIYSETRAGVQLSRYRKISEPKHLFMTENASRHLIFETLLKLRQKLTKDEQTLLLNAEKTITFIGGQKARGLGRIDRIKLHFEEEQ